MIGRTILEGLRAAQLESKRLEAIIRKWLARSFGFGALGLFIALATTPLSKRPYIAFLIFGIFFAVLHLRARKLFPQSPDFGFVVGWFMLACWAALVGFMFYKTEFAQ